MESTELFVNGWYLGLSIILFFGFVWAPKTWTPG